MTLPPVLTGLWNLKTVKSTSPGTDRPWFLRSRFSLHVHATGAVLGLVVCLGNWFLFFSHWLWNEFLRLPPYKESQLYWPNTTIMIYLDTRTRERHWSLLLLVTKILASVGGVQDTLVLTASLPQRRVKIWREYGVIQCSVMTLLIKIVSWEEGFQVFAFRQNLSSKRICSFHRQRGGDSFGKHAAFIARKLF